MARVLIGTSGWHYDSWRGPFFPKGLPIKNQLQYYASQFQTAELNGVFYRTPTPEAVRSWRNQTGDDFVFAWKASKFITHWKRLSGNYISLCLSDHHDAPAPWRRTADFVYVRGHGPGGRYRGHYGPAALKDWARRIKSWKQQGCDVFVYFDNDQKSAAPSDALRLRQLCGAGMRRGKIPDPSPSTPEKAAAGRA